MMIAHSLQMFLRLCFGNLPYLSTFHFVLDLALTNLDRKKMGILVAWVGNLTPTGYCRASPLGRARLDQNACG